MMWQGITALGGIGLFLLGMIWLTEGLQALAGPSLRRLLQRFTNTPLSGALTGAATTALVQSSSATTVTAVGFVNAGLLSFPQALGIIFGANLGTTLTGWLAAILGFKLDLGQITLPLIFLAALARLFGSARLTMIGTALAGFALIFLGIDVLKGSLAGLEGVLTPADFGPDSMQGRLLLVMIGAVVTLITQSSSAGVAMALALIGAGVIGLPQAMALVIGMDIGTTGTAALATLGGSLAARRTGLSHVIYNLLTATMAFALLVPYDRVIGAQGLALDPQIALVAFHSGFNLLGVALILPFAGAFARLVTWVVRARGPELTRRLGRDMLRDPHAATDAAVATFDAIATALFAFLARRLDHPLTSKDEREELRSIGAALGELRGFVEAMPRPTADAQAKAQLSAMLHGMDHAGRLVFRAAQERRITPAFEDRALLRMNGLVRGRAAQLCEAPDPARMEARLFQLRRLARLRNETYRNRILTEALSREMTSETLVQRLDAMRWLHRVSYHLWRIAHHRATMAGGHAATTRRREAALEVLED